MVKRRQNGIKWRTGRATNYINALKSLPDLQFGIQFARPYTFQEKQDFSNLTATGGHRLTHPWRKLPGISWDHSLPTFT